MLRNFAIPVLGDACLNASVEELRRGIARQGRHTQQRLLARLEESVDAPRELESEDDRVFVAKLIVALLPSSMQLTRRVLQPNKGDEKTAELQFSLFVALSEVLEMEISQEVFLSLLETTKAYLLAIAADTAEAAWMAGDLLGDHWPLDASLSILLEATRNALHPVGREAALHGLSHALERGTKQQQWEIMEAVRERASNDESAAVRSYAAMIASDLRGL